MNSARAQLSNRPSVNSNVDRVIHVVAVLKCSPEEAFRHFTDPTMLATWLADRADVVAKVGGKYEIFWESPPAPPNRGTTGYKISLLVPNRMLGFDWIGPQCSPLL
jgi:uncharacterized protein YndB with AHSA1/START domain